jgi:beta-hydroxylase
MVAVNRWVGRRIVKETETENEPGERIGVVNRIFGVVYHYRLFGRRFKAWSHDLYYATKYTVTGLLLVGLVLWALH